MSEKVSFFAPSFNRAVKVESRPEKLSSDTGALLLREVMDRLQLIEDLTALIKDPRDPDRTKHSLSELLRSLLIAQAQGWEDQSDLDLLRDDPVLAISRSDRNGVAAVEKQLASQPTFSRLLDLLSRQQHLEALEFAPLRLAGKRLRNMNGGQRPQTLTLDIDGLPLPVHGEQAGSAYNGHTRSRIHYPLIASCAETGDMLAGLLRPGNAGPAAEADIWIPRLVEQAERHLCHKAQVRLDAGFTDGKTLAALDAHGIGYIGRLKNNPALERLFEPYKYRRPGRHAEKPREWLVDTSYQAKSWSHRRRVLIVVREEPHKLFRDCFFLITNLPHPPTRLLALYRRRGKAEGHMGEYKNVIGDSLPTTSRGKASDATVLARSQALLSTRLLAYELLHVLRTVLEKQTRQGWSLRRLRESVLKTASRVQSSGRRLIVVLARTATGFWTLLTRSLSRMSAYNTS